MRRDKDYEVKEERGREESPVFTSRAAFCCSNCEVRFWEEMEWACSCALAASACTLSPAICFFSDATCTCVCLSITHFSVLQSVVRLAEETSPQI